MGFICDSGGFTLRKTGLFGAVWIEEKGGGIDELWVGGFLRTGGMFLDPNVTFVNSESSPAHIPDHLRGPGPSHTPKNDHPGLFQAPIARKRHFATGQLSGFFGVFFRMFLFWALYWIPEVLRRRKPACLELFGLRIGMGNRGTMGGGVFKNREGCFRSRL